MCDHSMWALYVWAACVSTLCVSTLVWPPYVWPFYVSPLCVTTLCEHSMCDHSMGALYVWPLYGSTLCVTTLCEHSMCDHSMWALYGSTLYVSSLCVDTLRRMLQNTQKYENYQEKWTSVLGPDVAEHRKVRKVPRKITISSRAGCCRAPKSTKSSRKNEHQFSGRMLQNTEKYEN